MLTLERRDQIMEVLRKNKTATVKYLAGMLYVSEATVRRDLAEMETLGLLRRTHGGAVFFENSQSEPSVLVRMEQNAGAKQVLATLCLPLIEHVNAIFMDSSSSAHYLAIAWKPGRATVFTTGLGTALHFARFPQVRVMIPGGEVQYHTDSVEGSTTLSQLGRFFVDVMVCSCGGVGDDGRVTESTDAQCAIKQEMCKRAQKRILLADHTKLGRHRPFLIGDIGAFDVLVTDEKPNEALLQRCRESGVQVLYADGNTLGTVAVGEAGQPRFDGQK